MDVNEGDIDELITNAGEFGPYQITILAFLGVASALPSALLGFSTVFTLAIPEHWCRVPELDQLTVNGSDFQKVKNISIPLKIRAGVHKYSRCEMYDIDYDELVYLTQTTGHWPQVNSSWPLIPCRNGWVFDETEYGRTFTSEFNLVCGQSWVGPTFISTGYLSYLLGMVLMGWIADKFGRKISFFINLTVATIVPSMMLLSPNFYYYFLFTAVGDFFMSGIFHTPLVLAFELTTTRKSTAVGFVMCTLYSFAMALLALVAWYFKDCYKLLMVSSLPYLVLLPFFAFIPESPRWLIGQGRLEEAKSVLQNMAKWNGRDLQTTLTSKLERNGVAFSDKPDADEITMKEWQSTNVAEKPLLIRLMSYPNLRKKTLFLAFVWGFNEVIHTGLLFLSSRISTSHYLSFAISGIIEAPASLVAWFTMDHFGRRPTMIYSMLVVTFGCVATMFISDADSTLGILMTTIGKAGITASYYVIYVYGGELLPTEARGSGMAFCESVAGVIGLLSPYIVHMSTMDRLLPLLIYGHLSVIGACGCLLLPETINTSFPETLEEAENFGKISQTTVSQSYQTIRSRRQSKETKRTTSA